MKPTKYTCMFRHTEVASMLYCSVKDVVYMCRNNIIRNTQKPNTNIYLIPRQSVDVFVREITAPNLPGIQRADGTYIFEPKCNNQKLIMAKVEVIGEHHRAQQSVPKNKRYTQGNEILTIEVAEKLDEMLVQQKLIHHANMILDRGVE